jgi:predicted GIY-YIG superfamily endonuclease
MTILNIHHTVCEMVPDYAIAWNDHCTCRHIRTRHASANHPPISLPQGNCTGRLLAGPCLWNGCDCTGFTVAGVVYLLHFNRPYAHAGHYTGWTANLPNRLAEHATGHGARLLSVVRDAGIGWQLARTWPGTRATERALKRQGGASRRCPLCGVRPHPIGETR